MLCCVVQCCAVVVRALRLRCGGGFIPCGCGAVAVADFKKCAVAVRLRYGCGSNPGIAVRLRSKSVEPPSALVYIQTTPLN